MFKPLHRHYSAYLKDVTAHFTKSCRTYGDSIDAVGWFDAESQRTRFEQLAKIGDLTAASILDVGCGLGDFYGFLCDREFSGTYHGIDLSSAMTKRAAVRYPKGTFHCMGLHDATADVDYGIASGTFSWHSPHHMAFLRYHIAHLWSLCRQGLAFNLLSASTDESEQDAAFSYFFSRPIKQYCLTLTPHVRVIEGYLPNDFTILMNRDYPTQRP